MKDTALDLLLKQYESAIATLAKAQSSPTLEQVLEVLTVRDAIQKELAETTSASSLLKLNHLDQYLYQQQPIIERTINLAHWRQLVKPAESAWWWFPQPTTPSRWKRFNWIGNFLTLVFLAASASLTVDIFTRFLSGGLDSLSALTIIVPSLLALLTSGDLTSIGQKAQESVFTSFKLPKQYWQTVTTILASFVLVALILFYQAGLPKLGVYFNNRGIENYEEANRLDSALSNFKRAIALRPNYADAHYNLGLVYENLYKFDQAKTQYQLAVENGADNPDTLTSIKAQNNLGRLYLLEADYAAAIPPLLQGKNDLDEEKVAASQEYRKLKYTLLKNLGWAHLGQKNIVAATVNLNEAIALDSEQAPAYCLLAQVYEEETELALENWQQCLAYANIRKPEEYQWRSLALEAIQGEP